MAFEQGIHGFNSIPRRRLADQPKLKEMLGVLKAVDIPHDRASVSKAWADIKSNVFGKSFKTGIKAAVGEQVAAALLATFGGGYGKVFALGTEVGEILRVFKGKGKQLFDGGATPQIGEWVVIHNGVERIAAKLKEAHATTFGDSKTKAPVEVQSAVSIGFCMGEGELPGGFKKVFNFETGAPEDRHIRELLVLDPKHQETLDKNPIWTRLKNIVLGKCSIAAQRDTAVPVDPGSEVVYRGEAYTIIDCDGFDARIKNPLRTVTVAVSLLTRGRVTHTNSHVYAKNTGGSFQVGAKPALYRGQWVWLPPRGGTRKIYPKAHWELGVLRLIEATADGYYAMDGIRFQTHISQVIGCPKHDQEWMDLEHDFLKFKIAAVKGVSTTAYKLGRDHMLEVLGLKTVGQSSVVFPEFKKPPLKGALGKMEKILQVGERNEATFPTRRSDQAELKKTRFKAAEEIQQSLNVTQDTANQIVNAGGGSHVDKGPEKGNGNASMVFIAVLLLGAAVLFYAN